MNTLKNDFYNDVCMLFYSFNIKTLISVINKQ